jgi:hypothetical protein
MALSCSRRSCRSCRVTDGNPVRQSEGRRLHMDYYLRFESASLNSSLEHIKIH